MNCKHKLVYGKTTKYYFCNAKGKQINEYECKNCLLRITDLPTEFEEIFGKGFKR